MNKRSGDEKFFQGVHPMLHSERTNLRGKYYDGLGSTFIYQANIAKRGDARLAIFFTRVGSHFRLAASYHGGDAPRRV